MKYLIIISILISSLFANYAYDYSTDKCEQYTLGSSFYLTDYNNGCVLNYQVGDFYYDTRFNKTFQIETALKCINNNSNIWHGLPLTFNTLNPLTCSNNQTLDKTSCSCISSILDTNNTTTTPGAIINNDLGLLNTDFNFLLALSGLFFSSIIFYIISSFLIGL